MGLSKSELGIWGEKEAVRFLKKQGLRILQKNFVSAVGEIDIVATDGDELVFVEVKTRTVEDFGGPLRAVTPAKRRKVALVARSFIARYGTGDCPCRFDVVGITLVEGRKKPEIEHVRNAFTVGGR